MKKTCFQILFILFAFTARAGNNDGMLSITNLSRQDVIIEVDGRKYPDCNNALFLRDLTAGYHMVKVYVEKGKAISIKRTIIYSKNVYVKPKYYVDLIINRFGRALIDEQLITDNRYDDDGRNDRNDRNEPNDRNDRDPRNNWPKNDNAVPKPIADDTFNAFIETIRRESFDDSRMTIAKSIIDQNYFTTAQVRQLVTLFSFENNKVEIAKYMYGKTLDRKNYFVIYNAFTFSKSKEELAEYIRNYK
ncbi:MAG TPA: DUF4476 domain-containing protein [Niastella sp.]